MSFVSVIREAHLWAAVLNYELREPFTLQICRKKNKSYHANCKNELIFKNMSKPCGCLYYIVRDIVETVVIWKHSKSK